MEAVCLLLVRRYVLQEGHYDSLPWLFISQFLTGSGDVGRVLGHLGVASNPRGSNPVLCSPRFLAYEQALERAFKEG